MIAKSATDVERNLAKLALNREDRSMAPEHYRQQIENLSMKWGLTLPNNKITLRTKLRKKTLATLHIGHVGTTKMAAEAKVVRWPNISTALEGKVKIRRACLASAKNLNIRFREKKAEN